MPRRKPSPATLVSMRKASLEAIPHRMPTVRTEEKQGKLYVTVRFDRPRWQQVLGADEKCDRTFGLDIYGRRVYESCDGQRSVRQIIHIFSQHTRVSKPEAETAVTKFMRTMVTKGLLVIQMAKPAHE